MQKWEYKIIRIGMMSPIEESMANAFYPSPTLRNALDDLNTQGEQSWELICCGGQKGDLLILKRLKP